MFYQTFKEQIMSTFYKWFQILEIDGKLLNLFLKIFSTSFFKTLK